MPRGNEHNNARHCAMNARFVKYGANIQDMSLKQYSYKLPGEGDVVPFENRLNTK